MKIKIRYFAALKEKIGLEEIIELPDKIMVKELGSDIAKRHSLENKTLLVAINGFFVDPNQVINEEDDVAIFPPVSGG